MGRTESLNLKNDYERACGWYGHFNKSEMALFSECTDRYAQNMLDTADIVREAIFHQPVTSSAGNAELRVAGARRCARQLATENMGGQRKESKNDVARIERAATKSHKG